MMVNPIQIKNHSKQKAQIIGGIAALFSALLFYHDYSRRQAMPQKAKAERRRTYLEYKQAFSGVAMPFAFLDLDLLDDNIQQILSRSREKKIRLASKSLGSVAVIKHILQTDVSFQGVSCSTAAEALFLAQRGLDHDRMVDLLVPSPVWEPRHIEAVAEATKQGHYITLMVDSLPLIEHVEKMARLHQVRLPLCLDIDISTDWASFWHSPIRTSSSILQMVNRIADSKSLWLDGLIGYEPQIAGQYEPPSLKQQLFKLLKGHLSSQVTEYGAELVEAIQALGLSLRFVNGNVSHPMVTEVTIGSDFYAPLLFDEHVCESAAGFAIEIVQQAAPDIYMCFGGGYVALDSAISHPYLPCGAELLPLQGASQTPISYRGTQTLSLGDPIFMCLCKAAELCTRFNHLLLLEDGEVVDEVTTYRGDGLSFL